jgi:hypothetical protein
MLKTMRPKSLNSTRLPAAYRLDRIVSVISSLRYLYRRPWIRRNKIDGLRLVVSESTQSSRVDFYNSAYRLAAIPIHALTPADVFRAETGPTTRGFGGKMELRQQPDREGGLTGRLSPNTRAIILR